MKKFYLLTPGPTPVPHKVRQAEAQPIIHHRTKEYAEIFREVSEDLKTVFKTSNAVLTFAASGTGAMEGAVANTLSPGDRALVVKGGKFAERWAEICEAYGVEVVPIDIEWGDFVSPETIKEHLDRDPGIKEVFTTLCETSTGTLNPIKEIGEIIKNREGTLLTVDAISGLGACDIEVDKWNVDICVAGSQKGLMLPPGLAFASVSEKAWKFIDNSKLPQYYFDFKKAKKSLEKGQTPYTPAVSLTIALKNALDMIKEEGIGNVLNRHQKLADATRAAVKVLGLELLSKKPANAVTAVKVPEGIDGVELVDTLDKKYGIRVAGGQAHLKGKIFRIAHLGYMDRFDIITVIAGLEMTLSDLGYKVEIGKGVKAAEEILKDL